jgi:uridylate kinase
MGVIITPPGGVTYPNITDDGLTVTISPTDTIIDSSNNTELIGANQVNLYSNNNADCNIFDFAAFNITSVNVANLLADNAFIVTDGGKVGFFSDTNSAVQANAIENSTLLNVDVQLNKVLDALRSYGLIKT